MFMSHRIPFYGFIGRVMDQFGHSSLFMYLLGLFYVELLCNVNFRHFDICG